MMSVVVLDLETGAITDVNVEVATALGKVSWLPSSDGVVVNRVVP